MANRPVFATGIPATTWATTMRGSKRSEALEGSKNDAWDRSLSLHPTMPSPLQVNEPTRNAYICAGEKIDFQCKSRHVKREQRKRRELAAGQQCLHAPN
jgi:hypothetical protein